MKFYFVKTTHVDYILRLKQALKNQGDEYYDLNNDDLPNDKEAIIVVWGLVKAQRFQALGYKNVLILERGYLGDRVVWLSLGWDDLNGKAKFYNHHVPQDRWDLYWKNNMSPWKTDGDIVLVAGQVITDQSISDCPNYIEWLNDTITTLKSKGHRVVFRPHPLEREYGSLEASYSDCKDFTEDALRSKCVVAWSSTSLITAAYNGIPTVSFSEYSMTKEVSSHSLDELSYTPDRNDWGRKLAYCQWTADELLNGQALYHIKTRFYY